MGSLYHRTFGARGRADNVQTFGIERENNMERVFLHAGHLKMGAIPQPAVVLSRKYGKGNGNGYQVLLAL